MPSSPISRSLHATIADLEHDLDLFDDLLAQGEGHNHKVRLLAYLPIATSVRPGSRGASFAWKSRSTRERASDAPSRDARDLQQQRAARDRGALRRLRPYRKLHHRPRRLFQLRPGPIQSAARADEVGKRPAFHARAPGPAGRHQSANSRARQGRQLGRDLRH